MKKIEAVIQPFTLDTVRDGLLKAGVHGLTVSEVKTYEGRNGRAHRYRGTKYVVDLAPHLKIEVFVDDRSVARVVELIESAGGDPDRPSDISILPVDDAIRIRTGVHGPSAL